MAMCSLTYLQYTILTCVNYYYTHTSNTLEGTKQNKKKKNGKEKIIGSLTLK